MALQDRNNELENAIMHVEGSSKKQAERLDKHVVEVGLKNKLFLLGSSGLSQRTVYIRSVRVRGRLVVFNIYPLFGHQFLAFMRFFDKLRTLVKYTQHTQDPYILIFLINRPRESCRREFQEACGAVGQTCHRGGLINKLFLLVAGDCRVFHTTHLVFYGSGCMPLHASLQALALNNQRVYVYVWNCRAVQCIRGACVLVFCLFTLNHSLY